MGHLSVIMILVILVPHTAHARQPGSAEASHMHTILERTFLRVDVLALDICLDSAAAARIRALLRDRSPEQAADSIAAAAIGAHETLARIRMLRGVSLDQFIDGVLGEQRKAVGAGLIADSTHRAVREGLPQWFSFLRDRGLHKGDEIVYALRGDTLRTTYVAESGEILLRDRVVGRARRNSVVATYFAPGSDFRDGLMESLEDRSERTVLPASCRPPPS
jgi:hypothetical protein